MIVGGKKLNQVRFKKLASGKIVKMLDEQYLRQDVPCGLANCPICEANPNCKLELLLKGAQPDRVMAMGSEDEDGAEPRKKIDKIFILDHHFALNQIDLIENCDVLSNVVVPDSVLKHLNKM